LSAPVFDSPRHRRPLPIPTSFTEPFWEGTRIGELRVQRCNDCGQWRWTPQVGCPRCLSENTEWRAASGLGELYSYTVIHRPVDPSRFGEPYVLAVVQLDEGPYMLTNMVECELEDLQVGMRVSVRFERIDDDFTVYPFGPVES
jgi:uncharacterized OB-fold protein